MLDKERVAELIVTRPSGRQRASGYRVTSLCVLTAAHAVHEAESIEVRFHSKPNSSWSCAATVALENNRTDIALLEVQLPDQQQASDVAPVLFGSVGTRDAVLPAEAVGYPRHKLRSVEEANAAGAFTTRVYRDSVHAHGTLAVLSNLKEGTLEFSTTQAPPKDDEDASPWEGMSGAALWVHGRLVGVISSNWAREGSSTLSVSRVSTLVASTADDQLPTVRRLLAADSDARLRFPDVIPQTPAEQFKQDYQAQLETIAPKKLVERESELDELTRFCAASTQPTYQWWLAQPWGGKTALLSTFALNAPAGLDVVAFFITNRYSGQSDSSAFLQSIVEQLRTIVGEQPATVSSDLVRVGHYIRLLREAAQRSEETGRRLILVVDGLDEDQSLADGGRGPSIASLLPLEPPPNVRVVVSSRYSPKLPHDVDPAHPLRDAAKIRLTASNFARNLADSAKAELDEQLRGSESQKEILGLIAAAGGGLTANDLQELTEYLSYDIDRLLRGRLGRTISERKAVGGDNSEAGSVYLYAHETLRVRAEEVIGKSLSRYRHKIHTWAEKYREAEWPNATPQYLFRGYFQMLAGSGDVMRMFACACDRRRLESLLNLRGGDTMALTEVGSTISSVSSNYPVDTSMLLTLHIIREELVARNSRIPPRLPPVWALVGQRARATSVANGIMDLSRRVEALCGIIETWDNSQGEAIADLTAACELAISEIRSPDLATSIRCKLAVALARHGSFADSSRVINQVPDDARRVQAIVDVAFIASRKRQTDAVHVLVDLAAATADELKGPQREYAIAFLVAAAIAVEDYDLMDRLTKTLYDQNAILLTIHHVATKGTIKQARELASSYSDAATRARALATVAAAAAPQADVMASLMREAQEALSSVRHPYTRALLNTALGAVAWSVAELGNAEALARSASWFERDRQLAALSRVAAANGRLADAARIADSIADESQRAAAADAVVREYSAHGTVDDTLRQMAESLSGVQRARFEANLIMSQSRGQVGFDLLRMIDTARYNASLLNDPQDRASALSEVGFAAAIQGQLDRAVAIAREAENAALATTLHATHVDAARALIAASADLSDYSRCMALLPELRTVDARDAQLPSLAYHAVLHSQIEKGIDFTEKISDAGITAAL